jgi:VanZ family protein
MLNIPMINPRITKTLFYSSLLFITVYSILPDDKASIYDTLKLSQSGFFLHLAAYFVVTSLGVLSYRKNSKNCSLIIASLIIVYSSFLEIIQIFLPTRSFNWFDIFANAFGALLAILILYQLSKYRIFLTTEEK